MRLRYAGIRAGLAAVLAAATALAAVACASQAQRGGHVTTTAPGTLAAGPANQCGNRLATHRTLDQPVRKRRPRSAEYQNNGRGIVKPPRAQQMPTPGERNG